MIWTQKGGGFLFSFQSKWLMVTHISIGQLDEKIGSARLYSTWLVPIRKKTRFTTVWLVYISVSPLSQSAFSKAIKNFFWVVLTTQLLIYHKRNISTRFLCFFEALFLQAHRLPSHKETFHAFSIHHKCSTYYPSFIAWLSMFEQKHQGNTRHQGKDLGSRGERGWPWAPQRGDGAEPCLSPPSHPAPGHGPGTRQGGSPKPATHSAHCIRRWFSIWKQKGL